MLFVLSKVLGFVLLPSNAAALLCLAGAALLVLGRQRAGTRVAGTWIAGAGIAALIVFGFSPVGNVLLLTLSERFPAWQADGPPPHGIIVLGGAIDADTSAARGNVELASSAERVVAMLELARRFPTAKIVFSGGNANLLRSGVLEADIAARLLREFDIDTHRVTLERRSRTTDENARFSRDLLAPKAGERWLLVTSAFHMPRAIGAFRAAGFTVEAYPVDWRTRGWADAAWPFRRLSLGLARSDAAVHEWIGLVAYWLTGRSSSLLPGPQAGLCRCSGDFA
ncbi:MAG: hypothetical protein DCC74_02310 [Proteobacteria bacterium]|nr:MAG: hypothetical protein DCC74_02310 [Pseudomonadota bacterium]